MRLDRWPTTPVGMCALALALAGPVSEAVASPFLPTFTPGVSVIARASTNEASCLTDPTPCGNEERVTNPISATADAAAGVAQFGGARASATLATGDLKTFGTGSRFGGGFGEAKLSETLTFFSPTASRSTPVRISMAFDMDGIVELARSASVNTIYQVIIGEQTEIFGQSPFGAVFTQNYQRFQRGDDTIGGGESVLFSIAGAGQYSAFEAQPRPGLDGLNVGNPTWTLNATGVDRASALFAFDLFAPSGTLRLETTLATSAVQGATIDFFNTATVRLLLPDDVTFTSGSGVFLSALNNDNPEPTPVPEPASLALLGFGLLGLAAVHRSRRGGVRANERAARAV